MRLIDADALKKAMDGYWGRCQRIRKPRYGETAVFLDVKATVEEQPTIDAAPVICCKDCKFWMKNPYRESGVLGLCFKHKDIAIATDETDWCSWAERRTE